MSAASSLPAIARLTRDDFDAVTAILHESGLEVDLEAELARELALPWVLRSPESGEPLAFSLAWSVADELHLLDMASHPEHRRKGHARALLSELLSYARREQKRLLLLEVRRSNESAIRLYRSAGFATTGVRRGYYSDTGEDALEMRITFDPSTGQILPESDE
ncbi:MAG TPA: GNAT family N-acetyltransferase [Polyangiaceae bacterium]|nr:GNAT family N-acetyltransferase [Polyangiaceae bacterium]